MSGKNRVIPLNVNLAHVLSDIITEEEGFVICTADSHQGANKMLNGFPIFCRALVLSVFILYAGNGHPKALIVLMIT